MQLTPVSTDFIQVKGQVWMLLEDHLRELQARKSAEVAKILAQLTIVSCFSSHFTPRTILSGKVEVESSSQENVG